MTPLVSIIIPTYNSALFIDETLKACLAQSYTHIEVIVVDDGSEDNTLDVLAEYGDSIQVIQQENQGPAIARNQGILQAKGAFIQFCDSDDRLHPEKVERCLSLLLDNPDSALVFCQMQAVDESGNVIETMPLVPDRSFFDSETLFCKILNANGSPIQTSTILARKEALIKVGMYRADPNYYCAEDWDLLLRLADKYAFVGVPEVLVDYRMRDGALSTQPIRMAEGRLKTIQYARNYETRPYCIADKAYDQLEAGRYQVLAVKYWQHGQNSLARNAFIKAIKLTSQSRLVRILYALLTFFFPISVMYQINHRLSS